MVDLLGAPQNKGEVRINHGFLGSETSWFLFWCCIFSKYFAFGFFLMLTTDDIFFHGSDFYSPNLRLIEAKCRYNLFSENQGVFMALRKSFSKLLVFAFNCYSFRRLIFKFNHSKISISSSRGAIEPFRFIRLISNVSYVNECICFEEISVTFWTCQIFYIILVKILLILSKYRSTFPLHRIQTNFVAYCFNRWDSCFWYNEFSYKILWFLCIISHFCCCFCFLYKL